MLTFEILGTMLNVGLLILGSVLNARAGNTTANELEQIKSLNETENLQIFGDSITIVSKNVTESDIEGCDAFEQYLHSHYIRIKSPLKEGDHLDFKLNDLIPNDEMEGREKKRKGPIRDILIPLLLALKYKASVVLPVFMILVTFVAFKGFWAGMSGLVISKVVGLKVLLQSLNKPEEDQDEHEEQNDEQDHSPDNEEESGDNEKPIVVFLHSHSHRRKFSQRPGRPSMTGGYYNPKGWDPWDRQRLSEKNGLGQ